MTQPVAARVVVSPLRGDEFVCLLRRHCCLSAAKTKQPRFARGNAPLSPPAAVLPPEGEVVAPATDRGAFPMWRPCRGSPSRAKLVLNLHIKGPSSESPDRSARAFVWFYQPTSPLAHKTRRFLSGFLIIHESCHTRRLPGGRILPWRRFLPFSCRRFRLLQGFPVSSRQECRRISWRW